MSLVDTRLSNGIEDVIQLHRLCEVLALTGFTRFEGVTPDIHGEYETDVERAELALEPSWFPAVENRGEGLFLQLRAEEVLAWLERPAVKARLTGRDHLGRRFSTIRALSSRRDQGVCCTPRPS